MSNDKSYLIPSIMVPKSPTRHSASFDCPNCPGLGDAIQCHPIETLRGISIWMRDPLMPGLHRLSAEVPSTFHAGELDVGVLPVGHKH